LDRALWLLIGFQARGWLRALGRKLRSVQGILLAALGLFIFIPWIFALVAQPGAGLPAESVRTYGPAYLLGYCILNVLLSSGERAIYFSPAEITFLFTGPFTRRQLLAYKVALTLLYALPTTVFLSAVMHVHSPWFLAAFVGLLLMSAFMQLFGMAVSLAAGSIGARLVTRARMVVLVAILAGALLLLRPLAEHGAGAVLDTAAWRVLSAPLRWFFETFLASTWLDLVSFGALGLLVNLVLLAVVFGLDADYLEAAAAYSSRVYAQIQRLRGGPTIAAGAEGPTAPPPKQRRALPMPPNLGGIGPVVWRQLTTALRSPGRIVGLVVTQVVLIAVLFGTVRDFGEGLIPAIAFGLFFLSLTLPQLLPFDFRADIDRLEALKTLPLPPWRLALGQVLPPTLILSAFQWLMLAGLAVVVYVRAPEPDAALRASLLRLVVVGGGIVVPVNFLLFALENVLFLLFPTRQMAATPGDFQALGRVVLIMLARMLILAMTAAMVVLTGMGAFALTNGSIAAALAVACTVLAMVCAGLIAVAGLAFTRVDVSRDKPA
jgi:hypothetical protein